PFVDLPLGATEDRVLGTLDFERALRESRRAFQPGLLAQAHRGILYIDEVNLLADHLVDVLLDAAAMGVNTVEREGMGLTNQALWHAEQQALRAQILVGQKLLPQVSLDAGLVNFICRLCCEMEVDGLRADLVMNKTARALAASQGRLNVTLEDIRTAAELVLP